MTVPRAARRASGRDGEVAETEFGYHGTYPFSVRRTVIWGDCDPAGIVYTPRVLDYAMEILEAWYREVLGVSWLKLNREMGMGAPTAVSWYVKSRLMLSK